MRYLQTKKNDRTGDFGRELFFVVFSITGVWLYDLTFIWKLTRRSSTRIIIGSINKQSEVLQLDDVTFNWKFMGIRLSQIITELRYKPNEVIQLLSLLKIWGSLGKKMSKNGFSELKLEEWSNRVLNDTRQIFCIWAICHLEEKGLDCKPWVSCFV